jgi:death-on-curing family protein
MDDFGKNASNIASEIAGTPRGHLWWFNYVLKRKYWAKFLDDAAEAQRFADEIVDINRATQGGGVLLSGSPSSAINTALYYDDVLEQGASVFKTIIKNHMFADGNKRTAVNMMKSFMNKAGVTVNKTDGELLDIATQVATNAIDDVSVIASKIIE